MYFVILTNLTKLFVIFAKRSSKLYAFTNIQKGYHFFLELSFKGLLIIIIIFIWQDHKSHSTKEKKRRKESANVWKNNTRKKSVKPALLEVV